MLRLKRNRIIKHIEFVILSIIACFINYIVSKESNANLTTIIVLTGVIIFIVGVSVYNTEGE